MATIVLPHPDASQPRALGAISPRHPMALTAWFLLVVSLGAAGAFVTLPGHLPCLLRLELQRPWCSFLRASALAIIPRVRALAGSSSRCRNSGLAMGRPGLPLPLCAQGAPGGVRPPAGLGDMAIGVTAPWIILALIRQPASPPVADSSVGISLGYWISCCAQHRSL